MASKVALVSMRVHRLWNHDGDRVKTCPGDHARHQIEARRKPVLSYLHSDGETRNPIPLIARHIIFLSTHHRLREVSAVLSQDDSRPLPHLTACVLAARRSLACDEARLAQQHTTRPACRPFITPQALHQGRQHSQTASQSCTHPRSTLLFALLPARTDTDSAIGLSAHALPRLLAWDLKNGLLTG